MAVEQYTEGKIKEDILFCMKSLNFLLVFMISGLVCLATYSIIRDGRASDLLTKMNFTPYHPMRTFCLSMLSCILLLLLMWLKERNSRIQEKVPQLAVLEIVLCISVILCTNISYNGIILLVIADLIPYSRNTKSRVAAMTVALFCYVLADYNLMASYLNIVSFDAYLYYYNSHVTHLLIGLRNFLCSLNILLFLVYMIIYMRQQVQEKERIRLLNEQLQEANEKLKEYAKTTEKMAETRERNRLAREIHDTLGHALTGIIAGIDACLTIIDFSPENTKQQLKVISEVARQGMTDVRRSVNALRPDALEKLDLKKALESIVADMSKSTGVKISYQCNLEALHFDEDEEETIYRVVQESITNAIRHGKANVIDIVINQKYNEITISIQDNGIGCTNPEKGFGITHMQERIDMLGGSLYYNGDNGFYIEAKIPIRWGEEN